VQAFSVWSPPGGTLGRIVAEAGERARLLAGDARELERRAEQALAAPPFAAALRGETVAVIAEVKRRSPSKGDIAPGLSAVDQAIAYERGGAVAVSVLTEPQHFGGSLDDLAAVRSRVTLPLLRKDFIVDRLQLVEARGAGASAVLLIARALAPETLVALAEEARALSLETLIEVRDRAELARALDAGADAIGINNRDLETLVIDETTSLRLLPLVPSDRPAVAESGMRTREDVERVAAAGADAVLVGSSLSGVADPAGAVAALATVRTVERRRGVA
jgi:indole-3-glycerol phosphate synthase